MSNKVFIPHDLIVEILSRVPVKSLMRFKCASKSWWWMISQPDPELNKKHLKQSKCNLKLIILGDEDPKDSDEALIYDADFTTLGKISNVKELKYHANYVGVLGCSNGVVCLYLNVKAFLLWNPSTRQQLVLPNCCVESCYSPDIFTADGFCYDESTDDYKVFRVVKHHDGDFFRMHIFSLKSFKWRICVEDFVYKSFISYDCDKGILSNGALHWILHNNFTLAFNLGTERFQVLPPPPSDSTLFVPYLCEGILNGCSHMILCDSRGRGDKWIMKDNSWSKLSLKNLSAADTQLLFMQPVRRDNIFMIYNLEKLSFENIQFPFSVAGSFNVLYIYFENLFPLHNEPNIMSTEPANMPNPEGNVASSSKGVKEKVTAAHTPANKEASTSTHKVNKGKNVDPKRNYKNILLNNRDPKLGFQLEYFETKKGERLKLHWTDLKEVVDIYGFALIGYVTERFTGMCEMYRLINEWGVECKVKMHPSGWLVFEFKNEEDRRLVLKNGPYFTYGRVLLLAIMPYYFNFGNFEISKVPAWIIIKDLPEVCRTREAILKIASLVGKPLRLAVRKYVRVLVEIDLSQELVHVLDFDLPCGTPITLDIEYQKIPVKCSKCLAIGHVSNWCIYY